MRRRLLTAIAVGLVMLAPWAASAQTDPTVPTSPPPTEAPTTAAPTTAAPTTAPATTAAPATSGPSTTRRVATTTTIPPSTTSPEQLPTLPPVETAPQAPGATTVETTDLTTIELNAKVSPIFPALSIAGFVTALLIVATQWFLSRRPGRATL